MQLTIFTPTYNRAYVIGNLYNSLKKQTCKDFEWVIVDDGSTDETHDLVESFIAENIISIQYYRQENSGKPSAHNMGVSLSKGEFFFCVDSDDYLTDDAVSSILGVWNGLKNDESVIGLVVKRKHPNGVLITRYDSRLIGQKSSLRRATNKGWLSGDTGLIFHTSVLKKVFFPSFPGEKFIPEGWLWNRLEEYGDLFFSDLAVYICDYLPDGYTKNVAQNLFNNPMGYLASVDESLSLNDSFFPICKGLIRYIAMSIVVEQPVVHPKHKVLSVLMLPFGTLFYMKRYHKQKKAQKHS